MLYSAHIYNTRQIVIYFYFMPKNIYTTDTERMTINVPIGWKGKSKQIIHNFFTKKGLVSKPKFHPDIIQPTRYYDNGNSCICQFCGEVNPIDKMGH